MSKAFYRKYRSKNLSEVVGQKHITTVLENALKQEKIAHAYLFTGPRGVGKTSIARILAHEINHLPYSEEDNHPDIIEIDAASNNGVDDIRELRERIQATPFSAKYRVYIIDEVHMLSKAAFNALLKTLEEPPAHAVFILATTDAHKLPATIISRTQRFVFRYISKKDICAHLRFIADSEKIKITNEALEIIAERGGGSFRDSISLLDQLSNISQDEITAGQIEEILGLAPKTQIHALIENFESQNAGAILAQIEEIRDSGVDLKLFVEQFVSEIKNLLGEKPHLVELLAPLQTAKNSNFLEIELLSILVKPSEFIVRAPAANSAPIPAKKLAPIQPQPSASEKPSVKPAPKSASKSTENLSKSAENLSKNEPELSKSKTENSKTIPTEAGERKPFEWSDFLHAVKQRSQAVGSILARAQHALTEDTLEIYTGAKIKKTQLDKAKNRTILGEAMAEIGAGGWLIETFAHEKPPEDASMAAALEVLGGGKEVEIDE